jgi:hypothetical protein
MFNFAMGKRQTNIGSEPLRWSLDAVEREFGVGRKTMQRRLVDAEINPGPDGLYTTGQIFTALSGDLKAARLKKLVGEAEQVQLRNAITKRQMLEASSVYSCLEKVFVVMKAEILGSGIPQEMKHSLLSHLSEIEVPA